MTKRRSLPSEDDQTETLVGTIRIRGDWARKVRGELTETPAQEAANDDYAEHQLFAARKSS